MRHSWMALAPTLLLVFAVGANAQEEGQRRSRPDRSRPGDRQPPQRVLDRFDEDGDGKLSEQERQNMRQSFRRAQQRRQRDADRPRGDDRQRRRPEARQRDGDRARPEARRRPPRDGERRARDGGGRDGQRDRGQGYRGPRRRGGPSSGGMANFMFDRFDRNDDNQLSRREFEAMSRAVRRAMVDRGSRRAWGSTGWQGPRGPRPYASQWRRGGDDRPREFDRRGREGNRRDGDRQARGRDDRPERGIRGDRERRAPREFDRGGRSPRGERGNPPRRDRPEEVSTPAPMDES